MVNADLAGALEGPFGSTTDSDCIIEFYVESSTTQDREDEERPAKQARVDESESLLATFSAHKLALWHVSERFRAQLERWQSDQESGAESSTPFILRVPLNSAAEVPAARAALKHIYTGRLEVGGVREAMEVRRQAAYLQILSCTAACDEYLKGLMQQKPTKTDLGQLEGRTGSTAGASTSGPPQPPVPPVLELYACLSLWPSPDEDSGGFRQGVLVATRPALVAHFKDTLATLNSPSLRQQLLELPAEALAVLLESDDFGTDCEDSVLLLLATWMQANYSTTDGPTRERLCRLVRLVQLSRAYLTLVLPALAADHEMHPDEPVGWFPVGIMEAAFITQYAAISCNTMFLRHRDPGFRRAMAERKFLARHCKPWDLQSPTYSLQSRAESSIDTHYWRVEGTDLTKALEDLEPDAEAKVAVKFNGLDLHSVAYWGFHWRLDVRFRQGAAAAGLWLVPSVPPQLINGDDSHLAVKAGHLSAMFRLSVGVYVDRLDAEDPVQVDIASRMPLLSTGWGSDNLLPLQRPPLASAGSGSHDGDSSNGDSHDGHGNESNANAGGSDSGGSANGHNGDGSEGNRGALAAWSDYLQEGDRMTGRLTFPLAKYWSRPA